VLLIQYGDCTLMVVDTLWASKLSYVCCVVCCCSLVRFHADSTQLVLFSAADDMKIRVWALETSKYVIMISLFSNNNHTVRTSKNYHQ
jgi:hypothetical protein